MTAIATYSVDSRPYRSPIGVLGVSGVSLLRGHMRVAGDVPGGLVLVNGVPAARDVCAIDHESRTVVCHTRSAADGTWNAPRMAAGREITVWIRGENGERDMLVPRGLPVE